MRLTPWRGREPVAGPVPGDARAKLGELVGGITTGEHVEYAVEDGGGERGEGSGAADEREERVVADAWSVFLVVCGLALAAAFDLREGQWWMRDHGDHLLGEDVERVAEEAGGFDVAFVHGLRNGCAGDEVCSVLGEDDACGRRSDLMACATDALHAAGDRRRRLDLDDEVDCAHVDAELEGRCADESLELACLEELLDLGALRGGERAVVSAGGAARRRAR